jgi:lysophospholipase L1-like esterase
MMVMRIGIALAAILPAGVTHAQAPAPQPRYVAMGSSFAAGPGVTTAADPTPGRCGRSADNYAHQLARKRGLALVDVSCSGAMVPNLLEPWGNIPAQVDALTPDTALVTVTIGGNDVAYIGRLMAASCSADTSAKCMPMLPTPTEASWEALEAAMARFVGEVRRRAPAARLVFVDYPQVLPGQGICPAVPLATSFADDARATATRLAALTARVAARLDADLLTTSRLSQGHDACSNAPWVGGWQPTEPGKPFVPYHPNLQGMTAIADALDRQLPR